MSNKKPSIQQSILSRRFFTFYYIIVLQYPDFQKTIL